MRESLKKHIFVDYSVDGCLINYHTSTHVMNGKALQLHAVYKKASFLLRITRESVSGTTSYVHASERAMKSKVRMMKLSP